MKSIQIVAFSLVCASFGRAQTSELFLASFDSPVTYVVQNGQIVRQFNRTSTTDGPGFVIGATIKMYGRASGNVGREYDQLGNLLAGQYPNPGFQDCYDGATDGTSNWTISHNDFSNNFAVLVGDANWSNMQIAFVPTRRSSGITYDATDNTLWISNNVGGCDLVQHYSTAGVLLGDFPVSLTSGGGYGIALDPADQTLWIPGAFGTQGRIDQYSKAGVLLQSITVPGINTQTLGAEFRQTPLISTFCTAGTTSNGCVPSISGSGAASASAPSGFTITVSAVEGQKAGILFYGIDNSNFTPLAWGASSSFLCIKAPTQRTLSQNSGGTTGLCDGQLVLDWNAFRAANPGSLGTPFTVGDRVYAQGWFRDPPTPKTTMLSDALEFDVGP